MFQQLKEGGQDALLDAGSWRMCQLSQQFLKHAPALCIYYIHSLLVGRKRQCSAWTRTPVPKMWWQLTAAHNQSVKSLYECFACSLLPGLPAKLCSDIRAGRWQTRACTVSACVLRNTRIQADYNNKLESSGSLTVADGHNIDNDNSSSDKSGRWS